MSKNNFDELDKTMVAFATIMALFISFGGGAELEKHNWHSVGLAIISALFFVGILFAVLAQRFRVLNDQIAARDRDIESMRHNGAQNLAAPAPARPQVPEDFKRFVEEVVIPAIKPAAEHALDHKMLDEVIEATGGLPLKDGQIAAIQDAFHASTNRYVKLTLENNDEDIAVEFGDKPFVEPAETPDNYKVGKLASTPEKPLTASQQRRRNDKLGFGPFTDAELHAKKLEARRAKRAAKKAEAAGAPTSTTTTTQPGQTSLIDDAK